jgi:phosphoglycolate phosphatase
MEGICHLKYQLIIFDFDGTLADTLPWLQSVINQVAVKYRFKCLDHDEFERLRGSDAEGILKQLGVPLWKAAIIGNHLRKLMTREITNISAFVGVSQLLRDLAKQRVLLAIVTSNSCKNVRYVLGPEDAALISNFECGVSIFGKQAKIRKILRKTKVAPAETVLIGDEIRDIAAAHKAGIACAAVTWGYTKEEALAAYAPDYLFTTVAKMAKQFKSL